MGLFDQGDAEITYTIQIISELVFNMVIMGA